MIWIDWNTFPDWLYSGDILFDLEEYESKGVYYSKSLYAIVNFRGVQPIYLPAVWSVKVPPRVQGFLWLFSQNKIMTCDNLRKRGIVKPLECVFCKEIESVRHLLFECVVARLVWAEVNTVFNISVVGFESVAKYWLCAKKCKQLNVVSSAVLWGLWNFRNYVVFNRCSWISMKQVLGLVYRYLRDWTKLFQDLQGGKMQEFQDLIWRTLRNPLMLEPGWAATSGCKTKSLMLGSGKRQLEMLHTEEGPRWSTNCTTQRKPTTSMWS